MKSVQTTRKRNSAELMRILQQLTTPLAVRLERESFELFRLPRFATGEEIDVVLFKRRTDHPAHIHHHSDAVLYFLKGAGTFYFGKGKKNYKSGSVMHVPKGTPHGLYARTDTVMLSIQNRPILRNGSFDFTYVTTSSRNKS
jgi:quercetin dioxygenase-like cupin family protein